MSKKAIRQTLELMTDDYFSNIKILFSCLQTLGYKEEEFFNVLCSDKYDEYFCAIAIETLIFNSKSNPNFKDSHGENPIQKALKSGYSSKFIINMINMITENPIYNKLDVNNKDNNGSTIMHTAVFSSLGEQKIALSEIYLLVCSLGYDSLIRDNFGRTFLDYAKESHAQSTKFISDEQLAILEKMYLMQTFSYVSPEKLQENKTTDGEKKIISNMLSELTQDEFANSEKIKDVIENSLNITHKKSYLHTLTDYLYDEKQCAIAIASLLSQNICDPNFSSQYDGTNFIQNAIKTGYSEEFIREIINLALVFSSPLSPFNINHVDYYSNSIIHTIIYSDNYTGEISEIYRLLLENGFDSGIENIQFSNVFEALVQKQNQSSKFSKQDYEKFKELFESPLSLPKNNSPKAEHTKQESQKSKPDRHKHISDTEIKELEKYGKILTEKKFVVSPTIGREKELKNLMVTLIQEKKHPLLVGEPGVGKTALPYELAYRIINGDVPSFLKDRIVLEVNPSQVVAGCRYVGDFEEAMNALFKICEKHNIIMFIDEIHTIYGIGASEKKSNDMSAMLKQFIDRSDVKVIGTTTEKEYQEFFAQDALKRRFEKITIVEPDDKLLYKIIDKVMNDYCLKGKLSFESEDIKKEIIYIIMEVTAKNHRTYDDRINNPDLAISIIDKAFAFAKYYDSEHITNDHFIESLSYCDRIYDTAIKNAIIQLKSNKPNDSNNSKILNINLNKR
jgi:ankyrin repeat protein